MKKNPIILILLFHFIFIQTGYSQIIKPAKFTFTTNKTTPKVGETIELTFTATIDKDWKLYSVENHLNPGPIPIEAVFNESDTFELVGKLKAIKPQKHFDSYWKGQVSYFIHKAIFIQKVKIKKAKAIIEGKLKYQTCTLKDGSCVLGKDKFGFSF
ncbi:protein-disulfide reductase DsbD domain-containing protein [Arcicella sp. LKC2W]|uniref:protein-disulfide reductase DsbD domain-containing protein n=1 Tax=Arcicella sp. LKC2W TaxID=2984198 RepID=UPI002B21F6B2|nr:protein-disulfide reductase DsbD domain-containing protein [Arcicella sp. LKC2W]MEA5461868.1 protein-disulfide reductase DsbD domain-containing protein [Arcicella sp. LKC2W]